MHAHQAAAGGDEFEEVLAALGLGDGVADVVVEEDGVELAQRVAIENGGVFGDGGFEGSGLLPELFEGFAAGEDGGAVAVVFDVAVEDQQAARLFRLGGGVGGRRLFDALPLCGVRDEGFIGADGGQQQRDGAGQDSVEVHEAC